MDPYDAILEQLKRAQNRGLEAVTNRLDFVIESLDELIKEAKSSVREAVPEDASELFPVADVETAVAELRDRVATAEERARALEAEVKVEEQPTTAGLSLDFLRRLDEKKSQSELLRELLPVLLEHASRAVVLVIRGDAVSAWSGIGFANAEGLRGWTAEVGASEVLGRFEQDSVPIRFRPADDAVFAGWLGDETMPDEAMLVPVCLRGKMMGGFYVDRIGSGPWQPEVAQSVVAVACWMIDTLHNRQSTPTPMLAEVVDLAAAVPAPPIAEVEPEAELELVEEEPVPEPVAEPEPEPEPEPVAAAPAIAPPAVAPPEPASQEEDYDPSATLRVDMAESMYSQGEAPPAVEPEPVPPVVPEYVPEPEPEPEPEPVPEPEPEVRPTPPPVSAVVPPPELPPAPATGTEGPQRSPEDEARHEEARRFARLLVSEIKLYNEDEVMQGRESGDLYHRLKDDIDRSREMFEKRIPPEVISEKNYFQEELVRILADGDEATLGM